MNNPFVIQEGSVRDNRLGNYTNDRNEGDSVVFSNSRGWVGKSLRNDTIFFFYFFLLLMFLTLFGRAFYLEIVHGSNLFSQSEGNRIRHIVKKAPRGIIYDRFGRQLVYNTSHFYVYVDFQSIDNNDHFTKVKNLISSVTGEPIDLEWQIYAAPKLVLEKIDYEVALQLIAESRLEPSIVVRLEPTREYISDVGLAHVLGYIGLINEAELEKPQYSEYRPTDTLGKRGVELSFENLLRGTDGYEEVETDALGRFATRLAEVAPHKGQDIDLTIDLEIQKKLYESLANVAQQYDKPKMAGVVMNPNNGEILALVSLPDFDNNLFTSRLDSEKLQQLIVDEQQPLFTRTISGEYPPGSTFKIAVATGALQEGLIDDSFTVNSVGGINVNGFFFPDWQAGGHGTTNIYKAIAESVNTFFYIIGGGDNEGREGLGIEKIVQYAENFGLSMKSGVDIPGEAIGFLPSKEWKMEAKGERWYLGDTYNTAIGQGDVLVTPLQIAKMTSIIASQGLDVTPHFLKSGTTDTTTQVSWSSIDNLDIIKQSLRRTVTNGSASSMQSVTVPVSGKTGTAQFRRDRAPHSWFTGFAPYDNPELVVTVLVEEGGDEGLAVKATRIFLESYFN